MLAAAALVAAVAVVATPAAADPLTETAGGVTVDWARGVVVARGVGPADRHAPSPAVARVSARRAAEDQARARLSRAVVGLRHGAGTVGDAGAAGRLAREIELAPVVAATLGTDGSARVEIAVGIEAVRQALTGVRTVGPPPADPPAAPPSPAPPWVIDARGGAVAPSVGPVVVAGGARWTGPVRFAARPPAGTTAPIEGRAGAGPGEIAIDGPAPPPGALVVVVVGEKS